MQWPHVPAVALRAPSTAGHWCQWRRLVLPMGTEGTSRKVGLKSGKENNSSPSFQERVKARVPTYTSVKSLNSKICIFLSIFGFSFQTIILSLTLPWIFSVLLCTVPPKLLYFSTSLLEKAKMIYVLTTSPRLRWILMSGWGGCAMSSAAVEIHQSDFFILPGEAGYGVDTGWCTLLSLCMNTWQRASYFTGDCFKSTFKLHSIKKKTPNQQKKQP